MAVYFPERDAAAIAAALRSRPEGRLVACLCAAWCGTCNAYQDVWAELAQRHPGDCFVWIDIETHADRLGDIDIENFPTVMVQPVAGGAPHFYGTLLPHAATMQKLLERGRAMAAADDETPDLLAWLNPSAVERSQ